ncbi:MAG: hypothetical protein PHN90_08025 [Methanothrix sp.]|jgi:hypothetical protein|nr:hypothetical protein [Methanothrix sp.]OPX81128.1 MAG: hypothetical protein A4E50_01190 [Methanosaeta sp. PtaB.Bin087]NLX39255.1 hypothetical protein [Methanothrix sp.]HNT72960.1 hypothetical protein [Methanothrix sp.]HOI69128.1 hypothetical protein [Methanothrix sp.]
MERREEGGEEGGKEPRCELAEAEPSEEDLYGVDEDEISREMEALGARKRSRHREEIEAALKAALEGAEAGDGALILLNLDTGESLSFDGYPEALEHVQKHKGRWYLAPRGIDRTAAKR